MTKISDRVIYHHPKKGDRKAIVLEVFMPGIVKVVWFDRHGRGHHATGVIRRVGKERNSWSPAPDDVATLREQMLRDEALGLTQRGKLPDWAALN